MLQRRLIAPPARIQALLAIGVLPDPQTIRHTAAEVLSQPRFQHDQPKGDWDFLGLGKLLRRLLGVFHSTAADSPVLAKLMLLGLFVVLAVLLVYAVRRIDWARRRRIATQRLSGARSADPAEWERDAEAAAGRHDYIGAVRLLFRAAVARLDARSGRAPRPGITNREYLARYSAASIVGALREMVETIDAKWYGFGQCDADDYQRCRQAYGVIRAAAGV